VQRIVRQVACTDVLPDLLFRPIEKRADLVQAVFGVPFHRLRQGAGGRLFAAHACHPRSISRDRALERLHLADTAARLTRLEAVVEAIDALRRHEALERLRVRIHHTQVALVAPLQLFQKLVGLLRESTRVDTENVYFRHVRPDDVGQHHRLGTQAVRVNDAPVFADGSGQSLADSGSLLFELEVQQFSHSGPDYRRAHPLHRTNDCF